MRLTSLRMMIGYLALACLTLGAVTPEERKSFNGELGSMGVTTLQVEEIVPGMRIPLHSIIRTIPFFTRPPSEEMASEIAVTIAFPRPLVDPAFLEEFFRRPKQLPFGARGVETVLTKDSLLVTIHKGVLLHLRNDLPIRIITNTAASRVFRASDVEGVVTEVRGRVLVSRDTETIKEQFSWLWTRWEFGSIPCILGKNCFERSDGTFELRLYPDGPGSALRHFPPRVVE